MTSNQIAYNQHLESKRHNVATEYEARRHNVVGERETQRHNLTDEDLRKRSLLEDIRHNTVSESNDVYRTKMSYLASKYASDSSYAASVYNADRAFASSTYAANLRSQDARYQADRSYSASLISTMANRANQLGAQQTSRSNAMLHERAESARNTTRLQSEEKRTAQTNLYGLAGNVLNLAGSAANAFARVAQYL